MRAVQEKLLRGHIIAGKSAVSIVFFSCMQVFSIKARRLECLFDLSLLLLIALAYHMY